MWFMLQNGSVTLYIRGIPLDVGVDHMKEMICKYGRCIDVRFTRKKQGRKWKVALVVNHV